MVRAKFYVESVTRYSASYGITVKMRPVYSTDPNDENRRFWDATPTGSIEMSIKSNAGLLFEPGEEYYVDFTMVEREPQPLV